MTRFFLGFVAFFWTQSTVAQVRSDSLTPFDTIGISQKRTFFSPDLYSYHAATNLAGMQLIPLMLQSPDSMVQKLARRARRRYILPAITPFVSLGMLAVGGRAARVGHDPLAAGFLLGGVGVLVDGFVIGFSAPTAMRRAAQRHNQLVRYGRDEYVNPLLQLNPASFDLSEADTVAVRQRGLGSRYTYRRVDVVPNIQLKQAMTSLNDSYITEGIRQNRVILSVGSVVGGISAGYVASYGLLRLLGAVAGARFRSGVPSLFYASLGGLATTFILGGVANRTNRRIVARYNERLKTR